MCGIVGYIGQGQAQEVILQGLDKLEYRGYDSAGIALNTMRGLEVQKAQGRLAALEARLKKNPIISNQGIGHTRWATHGAPTDSNAHPQVNREGTIAVVHNGIIENYQELKADLLSQGVEFRSETDTEVIVHLLDSYYEGDLYSALKKTVKRLKGTYALAILSANHPDELWVVRKESPLVIGLGKGENFVASDIPAILKYTNRVYFLDDGEIARIKKDQVRVFDSEGSLVDKKVFTVEWDLEAASKGGYAHYTLKEIYEQPEALDNTLLRRLNRGGLLNLEDLDLSAGVLEEISQIYLVACGTSYHAGRVGAWLIEAFAKIPVVTDLASEFRYRQAFLGGNTLMVAISQSGETADTLAAMREAKRRGSRILAITNVVGSSLAREADYVFYTWAGPEIGVCSTKAYTTQLMVLYMLAFHLAYTRGALDSATYKQGVLELERASDHLARILEDQEIFQNLAGKIKNSASIFYLGRGLDYLIAMEAALKLKEISYIHTEALPAGELKHGSIALIEEGTPVIAFASQESLLDKTLSNLEEVAARGGYTVIIVQEKHRSRVEDLADLVITMPNMEDWISPIVAAVPGQLIAYYTSLLLGNDIDKPRNLAKSVTVE